MTTPPYAPDGRVIGLIQLVDAQGNPASIGGAAGATFGTPKGYEQITALGVRALNIPAGATSAVVQAEAVDSRWRDDGSNPTASIGMQLQAGMIPATFSGSLAGIRFFIVAGGIINVSYYG